MRSFVEFIVVMTVVLSVLGALLVALCYLLISYSCNGYETATGKETKVVTLNCYIKDNDKWYMWEEYQYRFVTKGEM
jgi:hypothetical protein